MIKKEYLTKEKFEELSAELENLQTNKRKEIAEKLEYARSLGDLSENAEYHDARNQQAEVESRIEKLIDLLKYAEIIESGHSDEGVVIGSMVVLTKDGSSEKVSYQIVGTEEVDLDKNKISFESPLGSLLIGKKKGEEITFKSPKGSMHYKIVDID